MKLHTQLLLLLLLFSAAHVSGQITFPIDIHDGQIVETCSGFFVDSSGGDTLNHYTPNEDYWVTFVSSDPDKPHLEFDFEFFQLGEGDTLFVYDGGNADAPLLWAAVEQELSGQTIYSSADSLHFHFKSSDFDVGNDNGENDNDDEEDKENGDNGDDDNGEDEDDNDLDTRLGWKAAISCKSLCDLLVVEIDPIDGLLHCPEEVFPVRFAAEAYYLPENFEFEPGDFEFTWLIDENEFSGQEINYDGFDEPGAYSVFVTATDPVNSCEASTYVVVLVGTYPSFDGTHLSSDTVCAEEQFSLNGFVTPTLWTGFQTAVFEDPPVFINHLNSYSSTLTFDVFGDAVINDPEDIDRVCIMIEHVEYRDIDIHLVSPNNDFIQLKATGGPDFPFDYVNLGEPVVDHDTIPGKGYEYCFSPTPYYGKMQETSHAQHEYLDNAGNYYAVAYYMPIVGPYTPEQSFNDLAGNPMNGTWRLHVDDYAEGTSGHVFGWRLLFDESFYPDTLIFTPEIVSEQWYENGTPLNGNPATTTLPDPGLLPKDHEFRFEAIDNFGCVYDTLLTITVLPLPKAEIVSDHELPICEGDSTLFRVMPIDHDGLSWKYQWQVAAGDLEDRTYDTLMVKEPGLYTVMITDTITGCFDFFDKDFETQNCDMQIPNVFTPNGDGINDEFVIQIGERGQFVETFIPQLQIVIFNRHGRRVFEHHDYYNNWWDGGNQPDGTYFYVIQYAREGEMKYMEGSVAIIR